MKDQTSEHELMAARPNQYMMYWNAIINVFFFF